MYQAYSEETAHSINGVPGRLYARHVRPDAPHLFSAQKWTSERRPVRGYGKGAALQVEIRFDDNCKNGRASFAITGDISIPGKRDCEACGCLHEDIAKVFPELAHLIKWHLCATDGPMHYVANTVYLAGDRDHNGLRKGEARQIVNGRTGKPCWVLQEAASGEPVHALTKYFDGDESDLPAPPELVWVPMLRIGEGKERDLDAARRTAVWPNATDAELCADKAELTAKLEARLPMLIGLFRGEMNAAGLLWEPQA